MKKLLLTLTLLTVASAQALTDVEKKLYLGIKEQSLPQIKAAINEGANVNTMNNLECPLLGAVYLGNAPMLKLLIELGADCNVYNDLLDECHGVNPLIAYATATFNYKILSTLLERISPISQHTLDKSLRGIVSASVEFTSILKDIKQYPCPCCNDFMQRIAKCTHGKLVPECKPCMKKLIELLISHGASAKVKNKKGISAYSIAKKSGRNDLITVLSK